MPATGLCYFTCLQQPCERKEAAAVSAVLIIFVHGCIPVFTFLFAVFRHDVY